jgi:hypothetical protein
MEMSQGAEVPRLSRWMPAMPRQRVVPPFAIALAGVLMLALLVFVSGIAAVSFLLVALVATVGSVGFGRRVRALQASRAGEDIGSFARALDRRSPGFDAHVVRAVWDSLQSYFGAEAPVPLRPADRLVEDLLIDPEDLGDEAVLGVIAARSRRSLAGVYTAQRFGRVATVADLVACVAAQPRVNAS